MPLLWRVVRTAAQYGWCAIISTCLCTASVTAFESKAEPLSPTSSKPSPKVAPDYRLGFRREVQIVFGAIILGNLLLSAMGATIVTILAIGALLAYKFNQEQESETEIALREMQKDLSSWPSTGVLWWGAALTYFLRLLNVAAFGQHILLLGFLSFLIAVSVCLIWYRISKTRKRRRRCVRRAENRLHLCDSNWLC